MIKWTGLLAMTLLLAGCATFGSLRGSDVSPDPLKLVSEPADVLTAQQAGGVNAAVQGVTGISVQSSLPWGLTILLILTVWLSHRREVLRIRIRCLSG